MQNNNKSVPAAMGASWPEPRVRALQVEEIYLLRAHGDRVFLFRRAHHPRRPDRDRRHRPQRRVWFPVGHCRRRVPLELHRRVQAPRARERSRRLGEPHDRRELPRGRAVGGVGHAALSRWRHVPAALHADGDHLLRGGLPVPALASVRGAHEALSMPAAVPTAGYLFFFHTGVRRFAGDAGALFFCFAIVFYSRKLSRDIEQRLRAADRARRPPHAHGDAEREARAREPRPRASRGSAGRLDDERARAGGALRGHCFERSALPQIECDAEGRDAGVQSRRGRSSSACATSRSRTGRSPRSWQTFRTPSSKASRAGRTPRSSR